MKNISASSFWGNVLALKQALDARDIDSAKLLELVDIQLEPLEGSALRIPYKSVCDFIELAVKSSDASISLESSKSLNPGSFHALGSSLLYSETVRDFCQRLEKYFNFISTILNVEYHENTSRGVLTSETQMDASNIVQNFDSDSFAAGALHFLRLGLGPSFSPTRVCLTWKPTADLLAKYEAYFSCPIEYDKSETRLEFSLEQLELKLYTANTKLARQNDKAVVDFMESTLKADIKSRVISKFMDLLPDQECTKDVIAASLYMTPSTFYNRLKEEGISFQQLLDGFRKELAIQCLVKDKMTISNTAYTLGFTDSSNFSRAFKSWFGLSPRKYTQQLHTNNSKDFETD